MIKKTRSQYLRQVNKRKPRPIPVAPKPAPKPPPGRENAHRLFYAAPGTPAPEASAAQPVNQPILKAISIRQPYAGLIMAGIKNIENRSWFTNYRGPLAIVSTKSPDAAEWWGPMRERCKRLGVGFPEALCKVNGSILGVVDFNYLVYTDEMGHGVTDHPTLTDAQVATWWNGQDVGFVFEHPRLLSTPIPISGRLGLYNLTPEIITRIEKQLK